MPLDKCALFNETKADLSITLTENLCLTFTYMMQLRMYDVKASQDVFWQPVPEGPVLVEHSTDGKLELHMYHGRDTEDENLQDWGYSGPCIQADVIVVHPDRVVLYHSQEMTAEVLQIRGDLLEHEGKFYGDFSVKRAGDGEGPGVPALRQLQELLSGKEWDSNTCNAAAEILSQAGYKIEDTSDD